VPILVLSGLLALGLIVAICYAARKAAREVHEARRRSRALRDIQARGGFSVEELLAMLADAKSARAAATILKAACGNDRGLSADLAQVISDLVGWATPRRGVTIRISPLVWRWTDENGRDALKYVRQLDGTVVDMMAWAVEQAELARRQEQGTGLCIHAPGRGE
jgi:hypothetical protein